MESPTRQCQELAKGFETAVPASVQRFIASWFLFQCHCKYWTKDIVRECDIGSRPSQRYRKPGRHPRLVHCTYSVDSSFPNSEKKEEPPKEGDASTGSLLERVKETIGSMLSDPPSPKGMIVTAASEDNRARANHGRQLMATTIELECIPRFPVIDPMLPMDGCWYPNHLQCKGHGQMTRRLQCIDEHLLWFKNKQSAGLHIRDISDMHDHGYHFGLSYSPC